MITTKAKNNLKSIRDKYCNLYECMSAASRDAYMKTLVPGSPIPKEGKLYGEAYRTQFDNEAGKLQAEAQSEIEYIRNGILAQRGEAPSTEALNALNALKMRKNITLDDINGVYNLYGENYSVFRNLVETATEHKLNFNEVNYIDKVDETLEQISSGFNGMNSNFAEKNTSKGFNALVGMVIDDLPDII